MKSIQDLYNDGYLPATIMPSAVWEKLSATERDDLIAEKLIPMFGDIVDAPEIVEYRGATMFFLKRWF
jgi:hypothetical protein